MFCLEPVEIDPLSNKLSFAILFVRSRDEISRHQEQLCYFGLICAEFTAETAFQVILIAITGIYFIIAVSYTSALFVVIAWYQQSLKLFVNASHSLLALAHLPLTLLGEVVSYRPRRISSPSYPHRFDFHRLRESKNRKLTIDNSGFLFHSHLISCKYMLFPTVLRYMSLYCLS